MKKLIVIVVSGLVIFACKSPSAKNEKAGLEELLASVKSMEDSLYTIGKDTAKLKDLTNLNRIEYINRLLAVYSNYPESEQAPECLDKVQMVFSGMGTHIKSVAYADTLILKYPKYKNRAMVLEGQAVNYDVFIEPRDSVKVRYYYEMLLNEFPNLDKEKRADIKKRLSKNHLTFDEYIVESMNLVTEQ